MSFPAHTRTDKKKQTTSRNNNCIFDYVLLFLSAVIFLLLIPIKSDGEFPALSRHTAKS